MLRLPVKGDEVPPLVVQMHSEDHEEDVALISSEPDELGRVKKRRRGNRKKDQIFDETFARKEEMNPKFVRGLIGSVALFGAILVVALLWPSGEQPDKGETVVSMPVPVEEADSDKDELAIEAELAILSSPFVEGELKPVIEGFLNAKSPVEMAKWVRHPEFTLPKIEKFFGENFVPEGFSSIDWSTPPTRTGNSIKIKIQDGNFLKREIYLIDEDGWKVDWESWAGWSEMNWEALKESRPTELVLLRAVVSDVSYYNFSFVDEGRWSSYRLESFGGEASIYGYVPRGGVMDARLKSLEDIRERMFTVKVRYPDDAPSGSQVTIEEIVTDGWLIPDEAL